MKHACFALMAMLIALPASAAADAVSANGRRLEATLDATGVERLWPAGEHVNWETGVPDGKPERGEGRHTHCSAFVAATAKQLGVYILRPPEHGQVLLANAQYDWLETKVPGTAGAPSRGTKRRSPSRIAACWSSPPIAIIMTTSRDT